MKLSTSQILFAYVCTYPTADIAAMMGVSTHMIRGIKRKRYHRELIENVTLAPPGRARSNRHILGDLMVKEIYEFSGTTRQLFAKFGVSKKVAMNIKFGLTYTDITNALSAPPGEILVHKLTWDDVCTIRASTLHSSILAELFNVSSSTIRNIRSGRTRKLK